MNTSKNEMKEYVIKKLAEEKYLSDSMKVRIEYICRAAINRLGYELKSENNSVFLQRNGRIRIIEKGRNNLDFYNRTYNYEKAKCYLTELKEKFPKEEKVLA